MIDFINPKLSTFYGLLVCCNFISTRLYLYGYHITETGVGYGNTGPDLKFSLYKPIHAYGQILVESGLYSLMSDFFDQLKYLGVLTAPSPTFPDALGLVMIFWGYVCANFVFFYGSPENIKIYQSVILSK